MLVNSHAEPGLLFQIDLESSYTMHMKQIILAAVGCVFTFAIFGGFMWLSIFATNFEDTVTNPIARITMHLLLWSFEAIVFGIVAYVIYLVYRQYTDKDVTVTELRHQKPINNPEFE